MQIGLRTIKTGIAVSLSMFISYLFQIEYPFFAVVAALIVMQPTLSDSWKTGFNRMLGTFVGAVIGVIFVVMSPANPLLGGIGIVVLIVIMNKLGWKESIGIAGVVFTGIFLNTEGGHVSYALNRLLDTFIGISIAFVINYFIYPPTYDKKIIYEIRRACKDIWKYNLRTLEMLLEEKEENLEILEDQIEEIQNELNESEKFLALQMKEEKLKVYGEYTCKEMNITIKLIREIFQHLQNMHSILEKGMKLQGMEAIEEGLKKIKHAVKELKNVEEEVLNHEDNLDLGPIIEEIKGLKLKLKSNPDINDYPTDEVVKMLVFLYNLEETLVKFNIITGY